MRNFIRVIVGLALVATLTGNASAALLNWTVDSSQSFLRLHIPDQTVSVGGTSSPIRIRNSQNIAAWSDDGGRRAALAGSIATNYNGSSLEFLSGQHALTAIESGNFRPNPAAFDPTATNSNNPNGTYLDISGAPAAFAGRIRVAVTFTIDIGMFAFRDVLLDMDGSLAVDGSGNFGAGSQIGFTSAVLDVDGLGTELTGQPIPDALNLPVPPSIGPTSLGGSIVNLGSLWEMTYHINVPFQIEFGGVPLNASYTGVIVAHAIPEPSTWVLSGLGVLGVLLISGRNRLRSLRFV